MPSGLCAQCGPSGAKRLVSSKQIKQVKMVLPDQCRTCQLRRAAHAAIKDHAFVQATPIYLCRSCRRVLGYAESA